MGKTKKDSTSKQVDDILNSIKSKNIEETPSKSVVEDDANKKITEVPRGKPKSGRIWKSPKTRFRTMVKTKGINKTFAEKEQLRQQLKAVREASKSIKEQKAAEKEAKKERRRLNIKRTEENRLKSEIVQVISNSSKIKRMKKKQLRFIEKRDTTKVSK